VRRGLKIIEEAKAIDLDTYMIYVEDFFVKYFLKYPGKIGKISKSVYLVTEDLGVLEEALKKFLIFFYFHFSFKKFLKFDQQNK
jgi:hypothetical protein